MISRFSQASLAAIALFASGIQQGEAQTFTPIVGTYECAQFPNGAEYLTSRTNTGYQLVKKSEVKAAFTKERRILRQRLAIINELLANFEKSRISKAKLIRGANSVLAKLFGGDSIPFDIAPDEAEVAVVNLKQRILNRDLELQTINDLLDNCGTGLTAQKGRGTPLGVSIKAVSIASDREIYGGFLIYTPKRKNPNSKTPGGFNACIKLIFPDGTESRIYSGFDFEDICGTGTFKFEGVPPRTCEQLLPAGQVGYVVQKRTYDFLSLPDATTAQLLDRMRIEVLQDQPLVGVLTFLPNQSRDSQIRACQAF